MANLKIQDTVVDESFSLLIDNAVDFFEKAVSEIEQHPKFAVINFYNAIELFLKSRLMYEHWTLILTKPDEGDALKFRVGDFQSVSLKQITIRLKNIVKSPLSDDEFNSFDKIRQHRNKLVHFFHSDYATYKSSENAADLQNVTAELLRGWYYLEKILRERWHDVFQDFDKDINKISRKIHRLRSFLKTKFELLKDEIKERRNKGEVFVICNSCRYKAAFRSKNEKFTTTIECLVCRLLEHSLKVPCPKCSNEVILDEGSGQCANCMYEVDIDEASEIIAPSSYGKEALNDVNLAFCSSCENESAVPIDNNKEDWICLACKERHENYDFCEWCTTPIAGELEEGTHIYGCFVCDGGLIRNSD